MGLSIPDRLAAHSTGPAESSKRSQDLTLAIEEEKQIVNTQTHSLVNRLRGAEGARRRDAAAGERAPQAS